MDASFKEIKAIYIKTTYLWLLSSKIKPAAELSLKNQSNIKLLNQLSYTIIRALGFDGLCLGGDCCGQQSFFSLGNTISQLDPYVSVETHVHSE
jgi:hypothetical protein